MVGRDPIQRAADSARDLYDVATWSERTALDRLATRVYGALAAAVRGTVVALAALIVLAQFTLGGLVSIDQPAVALYVLLSVVPALALAGYVWRADVTSREPLTLLVGTFALGFLFAGFAAVLNSTFSGAFGTTDVALVLFFFLVVAPVEETVKWLAVRLYAYRSTTFDAVVDGAVYGAVAGLGFATIENAIYIGQEYLNAAAVGGPALAETLRTAATRTLAGPGHVIYSGFAGYYLGLAKFNPDDRGPIVVKGLLVAVGLHGLYNSAVSTALPAAAAWLDVDVGLAFLGFIALYDGGFGYLLYRKLARYRRTYTETNAGRSYDGTVARTEFDPDTGVGAPTGPGDDGTGPAADATADDAA